MSRDLNLRFRILGAVLGVALAAVSAASRPSLAQSPSGPPAATAAPAPQPGTAAPSPSQPAGHPTAAAVPPSPDIRAIRASLEGSRAEIEQAEATLQRKELTSDELQSLRNRLEPVGERLRDQIGEIAPKLDAARAQLEQLGPKPKDGSPPEGEEVARDRAEREAAVGYLDEVSRIAKALLLQHDQLTSQISDRRRSAFTSALFQRSFGLASPDLWISVVQSAPRDLRALNTLLGDAWQRLEAYSSPVVLTLLALAIGVGAALHIARRQLAPRLVHRDRSAVGVTPTRRAVAALGILLVETLPAAAGSALIYQAAAMLQVLPPRLLPVAAALLGGLAGLAFLQGLVQALFAPGRPAWRLVDVSDAVASSVGYSAIAFGSVVVVGRSLDALNQAIAAGLPLNVAVKGTAALMAAATIGVLLRRLVARAEADESCLGPYIPTGPAIAGPIRLLGWTLVGLIVAGAFAGYVAFVAFLVDQVLWVGSLAGLLYLAFELCERFVGGTLKADSRISTTLQTNLGLRRRSLQQLGVLASGVLRVVLTIAATMLALAPWGIESGDLTSYLRAAFFGFKVGEVTVSLSTTIAAIGLFFAVIAAARVVQRWLTATFLPTTELDAGLRNSIGTAAGYLGFFAAGAAAFGYLGLSFEKIAIVAGALSVGIGFGLQSVVNNFVSGLILLWERPIRVGDLVVVGDGEGYVRRISVRATEIETFDRSTIVVPNSNLISGVVKNRVRNDSTGRVVLPVNVLRSQDPARAADLLMGCASAHPDVLTEPAPRVLFKKIGDTWLEFELVCFVEDVSKQVRVQSDLNFSVFKLLVDEGILPPLGPGAMTVGGLEPVQSALESIADAIGRDEGRRWTASASPEAPRPPEDGDGQPADLSQRRSGRGRG